jgi:hypothetical protein
VFAVAYDFLAMGPLGQKPKRFDPMRIVMALPLMLHKQLAQPGQLHHHRHHTDFLMFLATLLRGFPVILKIIEAVCCSKSTQQLISYVMLLLVLLLVAQL